LLRTCLVTLKKRSVSPSTIQLAKSISEFSSQLGFRIELLELDERSKLIKSTTTILRMLLIALVLRKNNLVLGLYPLSIPVNIRRGKFLALLETTIIALIFRLSLGVAYVFDLPIEQAILSGKKVEDFSQLLERQFLSSCKFILVFNEAMRNVLMARYRLNVSKFLTFKMLDYYLSYSPVRELENTARIEIAYMAGALNTPDTKAVVIELPEYQSLTYHFYGKEGEWLRGFREDIVYHGYLEGNELFKNLSGRKFGLIYYPASNPAYYSFGSTSRFSAYVVAGLPLLVHIKAKYSAELTREFSLGIIFSEPKQIPWLVITSENSKEYEAFKNNVKNLSDKIRNGYFFKKAMLTILRNARTEDD